MTKTEWIKLALVFIMIVQVVLIGLGVQALIDGKIVLGVYSVVLNSIFLAVNLHVLLSY